MATRREVKIPFGGEELTAVLALPESGSGPWPGVVVVHEGLGLTDDIRRIAARFADNGYAAVIPDLFEGQGPKPICIMRTFRAYREGGGRALAAIRAAHAWLAARDDVDPGRVGAAGFCMGGGFVLLLGRDPGIGAAAVFYGDVPKRAERLEGVCPVVASYGGRDKLFGANGPILTAHLRQLGVVHDVETYPDAGHSFMSWYGGLTGLLGPMTPLHAKYHEPSAEAAWSRVLAFFSEHLTSG
jgi:carboxymethylenebutenolidase